MRFHKSMKRNSGTTLLEVLIAMVILALLSLTVISLLIFSAAVTRINSNSVAAKNIAQGVFERMYIDEFAEINPTNYPDIAVNDPNPVFIDEALDIRAVVSLEFRGVGIAEGGTASSLRDDDADWEAGEWVGNNLFIVNGTSVGASRPITANTNNTLTLGGASLSLAPDDTTQYMINNGKTVNVTVSWAYRGENYEQTIQSLIPNYRDEENLGLEEFDTN